MPPFQMLHRYEYFSRLLAPCRTQLEQISPDFIKLPAHVLQRLALPLLFIIIRIVLRQDSSSLGVLKLKREVGMIIDFETSSFIFLVNKILDSNCFDIILTVLMVSDFLQLLYVWELSHDSHRLSDCASIYVIYLRSVFLLLLSMFFTAILLLSRLCVHICGKCAISRCNQCTFLSDKI